ncbi:ddb1 and cul4 associated factor 7 [Thoreauomyces humboldtii]|nr:ddb1 and cul4 associated factor 7 [Thoreauomyces humboldtii]
MDIRVPAIPVLELRGHGSVITALGWAPHSSSHICSTGEILAGLSSCCPRVHLHLLLCEGDDAQALVWDISKEPKDKYLREPVLAYSADAAINQMAWSAPSPDWVAISFDQTVQALRV